jgi:hypothetical protein
MHQVLGTMGLTAEALNAANKDCARAMNNLGTNVVLMAANAIMSFCPMPVPALKSLLAS